MKPFSTAGKFYIAYCVAACGYFSSAAIGHWHNPIADLDSGASSYSSGSPGHSYSSGSYYGRSSGGFGGGGK